MHLTLSQSLTYAGTALVMCAIMTMLTPYYVTTMKQAIRAGAMTIVLMLLGMLLWIVGVYLEVIRG